MSEATPPVDFLIKDEDGKFHVNPSLKVGDSVDREGKVQISIILGHDLEAITYIIAPIKKPKGGQLRWVHKSEPLAKELSRVVQVYDELHTGILHSVPASSRRRTFEKLGKAMYLALHADMPEKDKSECFAIVRKDIERQNLNRNRLIYIVTNTVTFAVIATACITWLAKRDSCAWRSHLSLTCVVAGGVGAFLSVLQRSGRVPLEPFETRTMVIFQGFARIILGSSFGLLLYLAVRGDLLLGNAVGQDAYRIIIFAVIAGISERMIPELLQRMEAQATVRKKKPAPGGDDPSETD